MKDEFGTTLLAGGITCHYAIQDKDSVLISGKGRKGGKCLPAISPDASGKIVIPRFIGGRIVSGVASCAFLGCTQITEVVIPAGVLVIGSDAFCGCTSLHTVTVERELADNRGFFARLGAKKASSFHSGLRIIRKGAFSGCESLQHVDLPDSVVKIDRAFSNCRKLEIGKLPASLADLAYDAFSRDIFRKLAFPDSLTVLVRLPVCGEYRVAKSGQELVELLDGDPIEECPFLDEDEEKKMAKRCFTDERGCEWRYRVTFDDNVRLGWNLGEDKNHGMMDSLSIDSASEEETAVSKMACGSIRTPAEIDGLPVTRFGMYAFEGCETLTDVDIADGINALPAGCFRRCTGLRTVHMPDSVVRIGMDAFGMCLKLRGIELPAQLNAIEQKAFAYAIGKSQGDVSLVMPDTLLRIGEEAFYHSGYRYVRLNSQLKEMDRAAFEASAVADVEFGESLTTISQMAFFCCKDLENVRIPSNVKIVDDQAFASSELSNVTFGGHGTLVSRSAFAKCPYADTLYKNADIVVFPDTEQIHDKVAD